MTYASFRFSALCIALAAFLFIPAQAQDATRMKTSSSADIVQTARDAGNFSTLLAALEAAELTEVLKGDGPFTVFAPTNAAFSELPEGTLASLIDPKNKAKLQSILKYHVVDGAVSATDVMGMQEAKTLQGSKMGIKVEKGTVLLQGKNVASVTTPDIQASNGVIHVVDAVLMPPARTAQMDEQEDRMGEPQE